MRAWWILVACALAGTPAVVRANCTPAAPVVEPPTQSYLPPRPVMHLFWRSYRATDPGPKITVGRPDGRAVAFRAEIATQSRAFRTYRISVDVRAGSFYLFVNEYLRYAYTIDPEWKPPRARTVTLTEKYHERYRDSCGAEVAVYVAPSVDAPAYRLEWASTEAEYRTGQRQKLIFPWSMGTFWRSYRNPPDLGLGYIGGIGETLPVSEDPVYIGVAALYPDGSEIPPSARPTAVTVRVPAADGPGTRAAAPWMALESAARLQRNIDQALARLRPRTPPPPEPMSAWVAAAMTRVGTEAAAIAGLVVLLLAAVWHRLRIR